MTTYYCQQNAYPVYAAVPTWGACQDGDGAAMTLATSAIASIVVNAVASAGNTLTIMGVTLTAVASGATATQFNVGSSIDVQANNIATAINAATGLVSSSVSNTTHQLRNMLYARSPATGAPSGTVQVMTRAGSAKWNGQTLISASGWSVAPTVVCQFSGGVGGCFGYLVNGDATIWPSAVGQNLYGALYSGAGFGSLAGNPIVAGDALIVRGNDQVITLRTTAGTTIAATVDVEVIIDNGTHWPGDNGTFEFLATAANVFTYSIGVAQNKSCSFRALKKDGLIFEVAAGSSCRIELLGFNTSSLNSRVFFDNILLNDLSTAGGVFLGATTCPGNVRASFSNVRSYIAQNKWPAIFKGTTLTWTKESFFRLQNLVLDWQPFTGTPTTPLFDLSILGSNGQPNYDLEIENLQCNVGGETPYLFSGSIAPGNLKMGNRVKASNINGCKESNLVILGTHTNGSVVPVPCTIEQTNFSGNMTGRFETPSYSQIIQPSSSRPYLDCYLPDGRYYSVEVKWPGQSQAGSVVGVHAVFKLGTLVQASGMVKVTLELLLPPSLFGALKFSDLPVIVDYIDASTSKQVTVTKSAATVIPSSAAAWTKADYSAYSAVKIEIDLPSAPLVNTPLGVSYFINGLNPASGVESIFINPDAVLSNA